MNSILEVALSTKFPIEQIPAILDVVNNTSRPEYAAEVLLGINIELTPDYLLSIKKSEIALANNDISYDPWKQEIKYVEFKDQTIDVYVKNDCDNPTFEDIICLYSSSKNADYPHLLTSSELKDKAGLRNVYVKTGKKIESKNSCSISSWSANKR